VQAPQIKQPLALPEIVGDATPTTYPFSTNRTDIQLAQSSTYTDYILKNNGTRAKASEFSGKETLLNDTPQSYIAYYANTDTNAQIIRTYDVGLYYFADDSVFLTPLNLMDSKNITMSIGENPTRNIQQSTSYNGTTSQSMSSLPSLRGTGSNFSDKSNYRISGYNNSGANTILDVKTNSALNPSIYIKSDTVIKKTGTVTSNGNVVTLYEYSEEVPVAPVLSSSSWGNVRVGETVNNSIPVNTSDVDLSIGSGALPDGLTLDDSKQAITGKPTKAGTYNFNIKAVNNWGSVNKDYTIQVNKGAPQAAPSLPALEMSVGETSDDFAKQLPAGWIYEGNKITFSSTGSQDVPFIYNPDTANFEDNTSYTLKVNIGPARSGAPDSSDIPTMSIKVDYKLSLISDMLPNTTQWAFVTPDDTFGSVGTEKINLYYNQERIGSSNYTNYIVEGVDITVTKGDARKPSSIPSLEGVYGQKLSELEDQLPTGWRFEDPNKTFDGVGQIEVNLFYNTDTVNYEDWAETVKAEVDKAQQSAPSITIPSLTMQALDTLSSIDLSTEFGSSDFRWEDDTIQADSIGERDFAVLYNTDSAHLYDYRFMVSVDIVGRDQDNPPASQTWQVYIRQDADGNYLGFDSSTLLAIQLANWVFKNEADIEAASFDRIGIVEFDAYYNPNADVYNNAEGKILIDVLASIYQGAVPKVSISVHIGDTIAEAVVEAVDPDNDPSIEYIVGIELDTALNPELSDEYVFDKAGVMENAVIVEYNPNPMQYSPQPFYADLTVLRIKQTEIPSAPDNLKIEVGGYAADITLPEGFSFVDNSIRFEKVGDITVQLIYNPDPSIYEDEIVEAKVTVTPGPGIEQWFQKPWFFVTTAGVPAIILFLIVFLIIRSSGKKQKKAAGSNNNRSAAMRPSNYGQRNQPQDPAATRSYTPSGTQPYSPPPPPPYGKAGNNMPQQYRQQPGYRPPQPPQQPPYNRQNPNDPRNKR